MRLLMVPAAVLWDVAKSGKVMQQQVVRWGLAEECGCALATTSQLQPFVALATIRDLSDPCRYVSIVYVGFRLNPELSLCFTVL